MPSVHIRLIWWRNPNVPDRIEGRLQVACSSEEWKIVGVISCQRPEWVALVGALMIAGVEVTYRPAEEPKEAHGIHQAIST